MSITNKLNQIKNAIYGKDVRGAIHDAIKQVYDDASVNHDNANMEVKMARGTHNTLNDRLDKSDEIQAQTNAQLSTKANKNDYKYIPKTEEELTQLLLEGKSVYINKDLNLTHTIHINKNNVEVEFDKSVTINMNDKSFPAITIGSESFRPTHVRVKFPKIVGNKTDGSIGILVKNMGFNSEIFNPTIQGMERGIKTTDFDCMQLNSIYEPLLVGNKIGFDDTNGGIQACRIFGGRIEQNSDYGIIIASPNVHFLGTVIEGNGKSEVKLLNKFSTQYQRNHPSGARFVSCYFEHVSDNEESEGSIFILGDETQNNGWFGHLDLVGCDMYTSGSESNREGKTLIKLTGNALASGESQKTINIFGGTFGIKQVFDLQNVDTDTVITAHGVNMFSNNSKDINYHVNAKAKLICGDRTGAQQMSNLRTGYVCGGSVSDVSVKPCDYVYTKVLRVEPTQNEKGTFISVTCSNKYPWDDTMSGSIVGSLHYYSLNKTWYQRILVKNGTDVNSNWIALKKDDDKQVYGKPTLIPDRLYQHAYDYTNKKLYVAFGTSTIDDWVLI